MAKDIGDDTLADDIVAFFKAEFGEEVRIGSAQQGEGFEIETDAGASFTFEITGATRSEVAVKYFEHIRSVNRYVVEHRMSGSLLDGGHWYRREEKKRARRRLAILDAWAAEHLPHRPSGS